METVTEIKDLNGNVLFAKSDEDGILVHGVIDMNDPIALGSAFSSGVDEFDVTIAFDVPFFADPTPTRLWGDLVNTGEQVKIDGLVFDRLRQNLRVKINSLSMSGFADWYVERESGAILYGEEMFSVEGFEERDGGPPAKVIKPGEPGFLENIGRFDCGAVS